MADEFCLDSLMLCDNALMLCGQTVDAKNKEIQICRLGLKQSINSSALLRLEIKDRDEQLGRFYRNPFIMLGLGLVGGAATIIFVR